MNMNQTVFNPKQVRYIKLGRGGAWAADAFQDGTIPFGYHAAAHAACREAAVTGDWGPVHRQLVAGNRAPAGASRGVTEIKEFYLLDEDTLWVTVAHGHLWWAFADGPVHPNEEVTSETPSRHRRTRNGWRRDSLTGEPLALRGLSSGLTRTANYRMTVCEFERKDYLLRRIRGEVDPLVRRARALVDELREVALAMIAQLHWEEFETLVDLIFARDGWRRTSVLGKDQPDVDMVLDHGTSRQTAWVQVKTGAGQAELDDYLERFRLDGTCDRFYFVCSNPKGELRLPDKPNLHLWSGRELARAAIDAGLSEWIMERTR